MQSALASLMRKRCALGRLKFTFASFAIFTAKIFPMA